MPFLLSVLDQSPVPEGFTPGDALRNTIDLAKVVEACGYRRFWLAEHHGTPALACASPEVLIGPVAAATSRMRVGSGGVMLPHYSPLKVAESFAMLAGLYPGRVDLGVGRAAGTSAKVAAALQRDRRQPPPDDFPEQLDELLGLIERRQERPDPWLLGSSPQSAVWAAELGLPYVFADFINPEGEAIAAFYRQNFQASATLTQPYSGVAAWAICAETDEEAMQLSASLRMMTTLLYRGKSVPVPTVEHALEFLKDEGVPLAMIPPTRRILTGSPPKIRAAIEKLAHDYGAQEVFLVNIMHDHAARRRSYEFIAREFGIDRGAPEADPPAIS